jgi:hypothetical protein
MNQIQELATILERRKLSNWDSEGKGNMDWEREIDGQRVYEPTFASRKGRPLK